MGRILRLAAIGVVFSAACGSDRVPGGGDDELAPDAPAAATGGKFYEDVAPLLVKHCVGCHRPGGSGPFSLITYDDAIAVAELIPPMVSTRKMPPWGADNSGDCNTYTDARWLTDGEIATIVDWLAGDRLQGDPAAAPPMPPQQPGLARVDATAAMPQAYVSDQTLDDDPYAGASAASSSIRSSRPMRS